MGINNHTTNGDQQPYNQWRSTAIQLMAINSHTTNDDQQSYTIYEIDSPVSIGDRRPYN